MDQIGEYLVRRLVGEGGMGKVYEGEERLSRRRVALKVLRPELARSEQGRRLFLNEMQILAHLEHPNIVRSLASIEASGELVMVLEYLDGQTLRSLLGAAGRLPWPEAVRITASVASALAAAHGQQPPVIHRDLKPENIMVQKDGAVKVMDFGIAKVVEAMNQTNTQSVGTLQYMSPEQIDARSIDHRSDLYCLGLILYEALSGRPPFQSASPRELLNLQCTAEPPPLDDDVRSGLPRGVEQLLFQLLEKAPEDRPYLAQDVVDRLEPFQTAAAAPRGAASGERAAGSRDRASAPQRTDDHGRASAPQRPDDNGRASAPQRTGDHGRASAPQRPDDNGRASAPGAARVTGGAGAPRADTIALVEQIDRRRDVPAGLAIAIIVALSALAGLGTYALRSRGGAPEPPASAATPAPPPGAR
ncbi:MULTISPECIES: serine/threonine-protein kinase [Sorangium]|uniref:Protein kinase n=1 Tax=Sorangium cellulosum TaxID=56 RepID=A0A4P2QTP7_SORCE|nr:MULTISPECIES: serine/threonine-protein kinase [Sorangium]AUX33476.1 protein kinase [Sorangium cellulosum]WCQ92792.1 serine-threonine kinase [Sorangium sp. Soce836]